MDHSFTHKKYYKSLIRYWICFLIYCIYMCMTPVSISPFPLFYLGFCTVMVVLSDARYKKAYEALTEYRLIDFLKHKWTHNPNVDIFNKMFFLWLVTLVLSAILFWVDFGIQYIKLLSTLRN